MKRAKIMLTSIAVLAVVGGALAFKANTKFKNTYCILTTVGTPSGGGTCTGQLANSTFVVAPEIGISSYYYTTKTTGLVCANALCTTTTSFKVD